MSSNNSGRIAKAPMQRKTVVMSRGTREEGAWKVGGVQLPITMLFARLKICKLNNQV